MDLELLKQIESQTVEGTPASVADAEALEADAIVAMRYLSASVAQGAAEVMAYGTAVKFC